jgi:hypothetical protein
VDKEVYGVGRVRFNEVKSSTPDSVVLEFRGNFHILVQKGKKLADAVKRAQQINKPFTKTLTFVQGVPTIKDEPAEMK